MNTQKIFSSAALIGLVAVAAVALMPAGARSETVGAAAAVKPSSTGLPPGGAVRTLEIGTNIMSRERIKTTQSGSLQVMFLDKTTLTIGPNSDLLIDEFVYKANTNTGRFTATLTKGALRFVGGQISHNAGATITTPAATIGIRGGAALITHDAVCQANQGKSGNSRRDCTKVVCMGGRCRVKSLIDSRNLDLSVSQAVEIGAIGAMQPFDVSSVKLNELFKGGTGTITPGAAGSNGAAGSENQDSVYQSINEQAPEPPPPVCCGGP